MKSISTIVASNAVFNSAHEPGDCQLHANRGGCHVGVVRWGEEGSGFCVGREGGGRGADSFHLIGKQILTDLEGWSMIRN